MSTLVRSLPWLVGTAALLAAAPASAKPHSFNAQDLVTMQRISEPDVSPDGKRVVYTLRSTDLEGNRGRTDLWRVNIDGTDTRQLTTSPEADGSGHWSADGKWIYFLSSRRDSSQVWRLPADGGEAQRVTDLPVDVDAFRLSPDGARLVVSARTFPDCDTLECTKKRLDAQEKRKSSGRLYTRVFVRHWDTWADGTRAHLFAVPVAGGRAVDLMKGMDADCPVPPFGGTEEYAFTPDGKAVVFTAKDAGREEAWSTNHDLFLVPLDGSARAKNLTAANKGADTQPAFSPDGRTLAYLSMPRAGYEADRYRVMLLAWPATSAAAARELAPAWDRSPAEIAWSSDGKELYATADHLGNHALFALDAKSGQVRELVTDGNIGAPQPAAGGVVLFSRDHLRSPAQLYTVRPDGKELAAITRVNAERLADIQFGEPEQFTFKGAGGDTVYGWIVKPVGMSPQRKYPIAFLIHGGPQGSFGNDFHYRWNPEIYAGHGYAAVMIDFHGSTGYGQKFTDAINQDWGGKPLEDLQKGLAAALEKYRFLDGKRACALGASYGGYMINWIAGKWPDGFRCLVAHDGNLDERAAYFDTEELWFPEWDHGGTPWTNPEGYAKHNPADYVKNWKTPILVVHSGKDYRVVDTQGLSSFNAAQRRGVPSELLYFPDENHWVLKPQNSLLWHETVLGWLDRWAK